MLFSARTVEAAEALRLRLVDRVLPPDALEAETTAYMEQLAALSPDSIAAAKRAVAAVAAGQTAESAATRAAYLDAVDGPDFQEGRAAFLAKRAPRFTRT